MSKSQPQFRYATADEVIAAQTRATQLIVPTFDTPPQRPRQEDPETELSRMEEELFQLDFRITDSERIQQNASDVAAALLKKVTAKRHAISQFEGSPVPSVKQRCRQLQSELSELEVDLAEARRFNEAQIKKVGAAKRLRATFDSDRYQLLKDTVATIRAANAA